MFTYWGECHKRIRMEASRPTDSTFREGGRYNFDLKKVKSERCDLAEGKVLSRDRNFPIHRTS